MYLARVPTVTNSLGNAFIAFENKVNSNKLIRIKNIKFVQSFVNISTNPADGPIFNLILANSIISHSGGENAEIIAFDSQGLSNINFTNLLFISNPSTAQITTNIVRRNLPPNNFSGTANVTLFSLVGSSAKKLKNPNVFDANNSSPSQPLIIRPGNSLLITVDGNSYKYFFPFYIEVTFFVNTLNDTLQNYVFKTFVYPQVISPNQCFLLIKNLPGSGYKIGILEIGIQKLEETSVSFVPVAVIPIERIQENTGENVNILKLDSNSSDIPTTINIKKNAGIHLLGESVGIRSGAFYSDIFSDNYGINRTVEAPYYFFRHLWGARYIQMLTPYGPGLNFAGSTCPLPYGSKFGQIIDLFISRREETDIVIGEGRGLAIVRSQTMPFANTSSLISFHNSYLEILFEIEDKPAPPPSGGSLDVAYL